ncbi:sll1863 family stress response protein [Celerinatantimonas yamalensis]|uniref:Coiled coil domain-containing protein n=1 Tax=Celerinatantimonas yamalensis TaxID=559956 RepID=A0ABW9G6W4_9GAMM
MNDKELYQQKKLALLNQWQAEVDKLKAQASRKSADTQLEMNKQIKMMESEIEVGKAKLSQLAEAGEDTWALSQDHIESTWNSLKSQVSDAVAKYK